MKVTVRQVLNSYGALGRLANSDLPVVASYRLTKLFRIVAKELEDYEAIRVSLVEKYGKAPEGEGDGGKTVPQDNQEQFQQELSEILDEEIDIPFTYLTPEDLGKLQIKPIELQLIDYLFGDEEEEPEPEKAKRPARNRPRKAKPNEE